eukprot:1349244-Pyramimonas_sp.AAC.1
MSRVQGGGQIVGSCLHGRLAEVRLIEAESARVALSLAQAPTEKFAKSQKIRENSPEEFAGA